MSLDVYLERDTVCPHCGGVIASGDGEELYWRNITHNLNKMAQEAGVYSQVWAPQDVGIKRAKDLEPHLLAGLARLNADPAHFDQFNASNGWGKREDLVRFLDHYLDACRRYPEALIRTSR